MSEIAFRGAARTIVWASDSGGRMHGKEYYDDLPVSDKAKVRALLERMAEAGTIHNVEKFKKEEGDFYCFKSFQRRLMCFFDGKNVVITHGFTKKKDRLDRRELERAKRIQDDYRRAKGKEAR